MPFIKNSKVIELVSDLTIWFNKLLFKRTVHSATSPWPLASVVRKIWTAIVPDEPYRVKGLCQGEKFPLTPCTLAIVKMDTGLGETKAVIESNLTKALNQGAVKASQWTSMAATVLSSPLFRLFMTRG